MHDCISKRRNVPSVSKLVSEETKELLQRLPQLCVNYRDIKKNKNSIKVHMPPKKKGDFFDKLGFDYRNQIWYEGDPIDTYKDVEKKIENWGKPFE
jgi:deoxyxylulose-5-phosphate synthase